MFFCFFFQVNFYKFVLFVYNDYSVNFDLLFTVLHDKLKFKRTLTKIILLQWKEFSRMVDYHKVRNIADAEKLNMRRFVLNSLLDTEETYLKYLDTILLVCKVYCWIRQSLLRKRSLTCFC